MQKPTTSSACSYRIALALLVVTFLLGMAATFFLSARRGGRVTDANYYQNGLNYDRTASGAKNPGLYWDMAATLAGRDLVVRVSDQKGAPLGGGILVLHAGKHGGEAASALQLAESAPGVFRANWPAPPQGELHGTLRFTRGEASATQRVVFFN